MPISFASLEPRPALGPLDGRYAAVVAPLVDHLSEPALNRARLQVEVKWFIHLIDQRVLPGTPELTGGERDYLDGIVQRFGAAEVAELGAIERETAHDVKAVEYFLQRRLAAAPAALGRATSLGPQLNPLIHFALTSEDVNSLAYGLSVKAAVQEVWEPAAQAVTEAIAAL
ncbi:MAG: adenylosuccinate lyase, partial [Bifidobacteriaceae bacterium]|nr:adenylosuccinate lyase [Bifidobacteriaceae bacterium]